MKNDKNLRFSCQSSHLSLCADMFDRDAQEKWNTQFLFMIVIKLVNTHIQLKF